VPAWWSDAEDRVLRRLYADGVPLRTIALRLRRSPDAVSERRRVLGIAPRPRSQPWSLLEDELLRASSTLGIPASVIAERLRRPAEQVRRRRRVLVGARRPPAPFTADEDAAIIACWEHRGDVDALALDLGRGPGPVRLRAQKLGVHHPRARPRWRPHEDAAVRDGYELGLTCAQIATELAGRTAGAVAARAAKLGLATYARAWTPRDDGDLRQLQRGEIELEVAAELLARTPQAVRARARKLGIAQPSARRAGRSGMRWASADDDLLALHRGLNPAALAQLLDRSPEAITQRLRRLGLRDGATRSPHHPAPRGGQLTHGGQATVARELRSGGPRRQLSLATRLGVRRADIRQLDNRRAEPAAGTSDGAVPYRPAG
jgi:hypothetical protein